MCVRTLRTQQRTESQCHFVLALGLLAAYVVVSRLLVSRALLYILLFQICERLLVFEAVIAFGCLPSGGKSSVFFILLMRPSGHVYIHSMESLILAQDERWRRA